MKEKTRKSIAEISKAKSIESVVTTKLELDDLTKAAALLVGTLYVVGVLATNTYLFSLGVTDFSLLKARYIYTGAIVLIPIFLSVLAPIFGLNYFQYRPNIQPDKSSSSFDRMFVAIMNSRLVSWEMLIIGLALPFVVFFVFSIAHEQGDIVSAILLSLWMYLVCFGAGLFGTMAIAATLPKEASTRLLESILPRKTKKKPAPKPKTMNEPPNWITAFGLALFTVGYFAYYLSLSGSVILTKIPEQFGGTKPHQARLVFNADAVQGARELGIEIPKDKLISQNLNILFEGENLVVVRGSNEHVIQLSKDMLQAVDVDLSPHLNR